MLLIRHTAIDASCISVNTLKESSSSYFLDHIHHTRRVLRFDPNIKLFEVVVLVHGNRDIPSALHAPGELHEIACLDLHVVVAMPVGKDLHLPLQKVAGLLPRVRPREFARGASPPNEQITYRKCQYNSDQSHGVFKHSNVHRMNKEGTQIMGSSEFPTFMD